MKRTAILLSLLLIPAISVAQAGKLELPNLDHLAKKAKESVEITLDSDLLQTAGRFMGGAIEGADAEVAEILRGLQGIYVRSFEFDKPDMYDKKDVDGLRRQLSNSSWSKLISTHSADEATDVYMRKDSKDGGLAIIVSEPKELTIINIVGKVDLEKLRRLQGKLGVPKVVGD